MRLYTSSCRKTVAYNKLLTLSVSKILNFSYIFRCIACVHITHLLLYMSPREREIHCGRTILLMITDQLFIFILSTIEFNVFAIYTFLTLIRHVVHKMILMTIIQFKYFCNTVLRSSAASLMRFLPFILLMVSSGVVVWQIMHLSI